MIKKDTALILGIVLAIAACFILDWHTPLGAADATVYVIPVLLCLWSPRKYFTLVIMLVCLALTLAGVYLSPPGGELWKVVYNRGLAALAIVMTAVLSVRYSKQASKINETMDFVRTLLSDSFDAVVTISEDGTVLSWNSSAEQMFGWFVNEALGKKVSELIIPPQLRKAHEDGLRRFITTGEWKILNQHIEIAGMRKSGAEIPVELTVSTLRSGKNRVFTAIIRDLTGKRHSDEEIRKLSLAVKQSGHSVAITDINGIIEYANPMFCNVSGYTLKELVGQNPRVLNSGKHPKWFFENLWKTILSGKEWRGDICNKKKNGEFYWEFVSICPVFNDSGKIINFLVTRVDDSERKLAEEKLKHYAEELARSNKDLEDFASIASHDLQEPLRKITTFGDRLLATEKSLTEEGKDYISRMQRASVRMKRLIEDLLLFSRVKTKNQPFGPVDLGCVIDEVREVLEVKIKKAGGIIDASSLPTIEADYQQLCQLFQNIISNALKYHKEGVPPHITVEGRENGKEQWEISIKDNGIGFDEKYAEKIFKPFERLHGKDAYEGTGIGLAICKKIVDRHNGVIAVKSAPGEGSTFVITLPAKQANRESGGKTG